MSGYLQQQNQNNTQQPKSCERIVQGVAKLSTFKIPSTHLKRCSEGALPLNEQTIIGGSGGQPKILVNGNINGKVVTKENNEDNWPSINLSPSTNCLRVSSSGVDISNSSSGFNENCGGKRLYSLDSSTSNNNMSGGRSELNNLKNQQQFLISDTTELRLKRDRKWWNRTAASYCFLFISIILSLSVVIGVCLFLHSFIPKDYYNKNIIKINENKTINSTNNSSNNEIKLLKTFVESILIL
uniref:Uncharacterized protein n=2 Tax=Meloidogyne enterolobii TaxID=390850 RepID=A0A6V7Y0J1_MELEN|nr:unnamed protein product [Meloidogyne enterolobii]